MRWNSTVIDGDSKNLATTSAARIGERAVTKPSKTIVSANDSHGSFAPGKESDARRPRNRADDENYSSAGISKTQPHIVSGLNGIYCSRDAVSHRVEQRKTVGGEFQDRDRALAKVLLVTEVLIRRDKQVEQAVQASEQGAVESARQSLLLDGRNQVV
jgi:hypothetical protein